MRLDLADSARGEDAQLCASSASYLHVFPQRAGMSVGLVAQFAQVRLVRCVHVHVLLPVAAVGETSVTALKLAQKRLLSWKEKKALKMS